MDQAVSRLAIKRRRVKLAAGLALASIRDMMDDIVWLNREQCKRRAIHIGWTRCDDIAPQRIDRQLMEQALLNIVKNALEAVEAGQQQTNGGNKGGGGGYIHLALVAAVDGRGATLSVVDSGRQLGAVPARQLFTPFFSTKKRGQGIGLVFVREVLTRHGFGFALAPDAQGETRFDIRFPP
jgi:two-component system nitrogen regulation sensor histidine kinase NtrY